MISMNDRRKHLAYWVTKAALSVAHMPMMMPISSSLSWSWLAGVTAACNFGAKAWKPPLPAQLPLRIANSAGRRVMTAGRYA